MPKHSGKPVVPTYKRVCAEEKNEARRCDREDRYTRQAKAKAKERKHIELDKAAERTDVAATAVISKTSIKDSRAAERRRVDRTL